MKNHTKTQPDNYVITLEIGGKSYASKGDTLLEAINGLPKPETIKTKGVLEVKYCNLSTTRLMNIIQIKRLFAKDFVREILAKNLALFLR